MANDLLPRMAAIFSGRFRDGTVAPAIEHAPPDGEFALSFYQERVWEAMRRDPLTTAFHGGFSFRLRGAPDLSALERSLSEVVARHDALRLVFAADRPVARVVEPRPVELARVDLRASSSPLKEGQRVLRDETLRPFELDRALPLRATLLQFAADDYLLLLSYHELVLSRPAVAMVLAEVEKLYPAFAAGEASPLEPPAFQLSDFMRWQRAWLHGDELSRRLSRWRERFATFAPAAVPEDAPAPPGQSHEDIEIPPPMLAACAELGKQDSATPFMVQSAALAQLASERMGKERIALPTMVTIRRRELLHVIGTFSTEMYLCVDLSGRPSFRELVARTKEATLEATEDQNLPVWSARPAGAAAVDGLLVDYFANIPLPLSLAGQNAPKENFPIERAVAHPIEWRTYTYGVETKCVAPYEIGRYRKETITGLLARFVKLLGDGLDHPDRPLT